MVSQPRRPRLENRGLLFNKYCYGDEIKQDEMGGYVACMGKSDVGINYFVTKLQEEGTKFETPMPRP